MLVLLEQLLRFLEAAIIETIPVTEILKPGFSLASTQVSRAVASHCGVLGTVIDVGANVGQFALAAHRSFPEAAIFSFEPAPDARKLLIRNLQGIPFATVFPFALGSAEGKIEFHVSKYSHVSSVLDIAPSNYNPNYRGNALSTITVDVTTLDRIVELMDLSEPILLKLDVQGFEAEVLKGATRVLKRVEWVVIESSFEELYVGQPLHSAINALLTSLGYEFVAPVGFQRGRAGKIIEMDSLYRRATK